MSPREILMPPFFSDQAKGPVVKSRPHVQHRTPSTTGIVKDRFSVLVYAAYFNDVYLYGGMGECRTLRETWACGSSVEKKRPTPSTTGIGGRHIEVTHSPTPPQAPLD